MKNKREAIVAAVHTGLCGEEGGKRAMNFKVCPECNGTKILPNGEHCKSCLWGMVMEREDCKQKDWYDVLNLKADRRKRKRREKNNAIKANFN